MMGEQVARPYFYLLPKQWIRMAINIPPMGLKKPLCRQISAQRREKVTLFHSVWAQVLLTGEKRHPLPRLKAAHRHISRTHNPRSLTPLTAGDGDSLTEGWTDSFRSQIFTTNIIHTFVSFVKGFLNFFRRGG